MKALKPLLKLILGCMLVTVLSGCWDYRRLDQTAMVMGIGIDPAGNGEYNVTFQLPSMPGVLSGAGSEAGGGGAPPAPTINITVKGDSIENAMAWAQERLDRTLFFGNLQSIVINEKLNQKQTQGALVELLRNSRIPNTASLFVSNDTAVNILSAKEITDEPVSIFLRNSVRDVKSTGFEKPIPLWVYFRNVYGHGITPVIPRVLSNSEGKLIFDGLGVYQNFELKGDLTRREARGFNWIAGDVKQMQLMVQGKDHPIEVSIRHEKALMSWQKKNGRYQLYVTIKAVGILMQDPSEGDREVAMKAMQKDQERADAEVKKEIRDTFKKFQKWGTDPYGYGRLVLIQDPHLFKSDHLGTRWIPEFKDSNLHVKVEIEIKGKGELL